MPHVSQVAVISPKTPLRRPGVTSDADKLRLRLWLRLLSCTRAIETEVRARLRVDFETTLPRFDVLAQLEPQKSGLTMGELSVRLKVTSGNVTGLIDAMEHDGLVARKRHRTDGRSTVIVISPRGRRLFLAMAPAHHAWIDEIMAEVPTADLTTLLASLEKLKASTRTAVAK